MDRVNDPKAAGWFEGYKKVMIERPIAIGGDDSRRPDRVVWTADGYIDVIDFKSGNQNLSATSNRSRNTSDYCQCSAIKTSEASSTTLTPDRL